jgi:thymidylate synthase
MQHPEYQYLNLLADVMENGYEKHEFNTGIALKSVFGRMMRFDLSQGFPLLTTKKVFIKGIIHELVWFLRGDTNIKYLVENNIHIWDDWAYKEYDKASKRGEVPPMTMDEFVAQVKGDTAFAKRWGELGPVYGRQWRRWKASDGREIDQLQWAIEKLKKYPDRKHVVVSAWNPEFIYEMALPGTSMALPPCHTLFQFNVMGGKLSCQLFQR